MVSSLRVAELVQIARGVMGVVAGVGWIGSRRRFAKGARRLNEVVRVRRPGRPGGGGDRR